MLMAWQLKMSAYDSGSAFGSSGKKGAGPKLTLPFIQGWAGPSFPIWKLAKRNLASAPLRSSLWRLTCHWAGSCAASEYCLAAAPRYLRDGPLGFLTALDYLGSVFREYLLGDSQ